MHSNARMHVAEYSALWALTLKLDARNGARPDAISYKTQPSDLRGVSVCDFVCVCVCVCVCVWERERERERESERERVSERERESEFLGA
jgi:hypothetical protein